MAASDQFVETTTSAALEEKAKLSKEIDEGKVVPPGLDQTGAGGSA